MPISLEIFLVQCLLIFGLATPGIAPYTGVYFALAAMIYGFCHLLTGNERLWDVGPWRMLFAAVILLLIPMPFHWSGPEDFFPLLAILPILLAPGVTVLVRSYPSILSLETMCWALLGGIVAAVGLAWFEAMALGVIRPGGDNNPIHFGGIAVILGFGSMTGVFVVSGLWRLVFLLGPVLAAVAVVLSGSRGPAIAVFVLGALAAGFLIWDWRKSRFVWVLLLGILASGGLIWFLLHNTPEFERIWQSLMNAPAILSGTNAGLGWERVALITGAIGAYLDAPVVGHGFSHMMSAIVPHLSSEQAGVAAFEHLHSDPADFGVAGGVFGLAALAALLLSPLEGAQIHRGRASYLGILYLSITLGLGFFLLGLTNAMIGLLPQTVLFGVLLGFVVGGAGSRH